MLCETKTVLPFTPISSVVFFNCLWLSFSSVGLFSSRVWFYYVPLHGLELPLSEAENFALTCLLALYLLKY